MSRYDLTEDAWNAIRNWMPAQQVGPGRRWADHRQIVNGILWILCTGSPWRDLPAEFGKWQTVYNRFRRWTQSGLWLRLYKHLIDKRDTQGKISRTFWCIDGSVVRAHRCASGQRPKGLEKDRRIALGRSRGGYTTKIHVMTDSRGTILGLTLTGGHVHDSKELESVLSHSLLSIHRLKKRPRMLVGDKGYSSQTIRNLLRSKQIRPVIATRKNERRQRDFKPSIYKKRNIIERVIGWLKESRRVATRYDKLADHYLAFVWIAATRKLLKDHLRDST